jgi:hypothetical protein
MRHSATMPPTLGCAGSDAACVGALVTTGATLIFCAIAESTLAIAVWLAQLPNVCTACPGVSESGVKSTISYTWLYGIPCMVPLSEKLVHEPVRQCAQ